MLSSSGTQGELIGRRKVAGWVLFAAGAEAISEAVSEAVSGTVFETVFEAVFEAMTIFEAEISIILDVHLYIFDKELLTKNQKKIRVSL